MMLEEQRWKRMGEVRGKILEAQVFELASLLSAWSRPSDSSQELHPKRCVILPSESAKLQRNRVIRGEGCSSRASIQPADMSRTETDKQGLSGSARKAQLAEQERQRHDPLSNMLLQYEATLSTQMSLTMVTGVGKQWHMRKRKKRNWDKDLDGGMTQCFKMIETPPQDYLVSQEKRCFFLCTPTLGSHSFLSRYLAWAPKPLDLKCFEGMGSGQSVCCLTYIQMLVTSTIPQGTQAKKTGKYLLLVLSL